MELIPPGQQNAGWKKLDQRHQADQECERVEAPPLRLPSCVRPSARKCAICQSITLARTRIVASSGSQVNSSAKLFDEISHRPKNVQPPSPGPGSSQQPQPRSDAAAKSSLTNQRPANQSPTSSKGKPQNQSLPSLPRNRLVVQVRSTTRTNSSPAEQSVPASSPQSLPSFCRRQRRVILGCRSSLW